jgi:DNA-binding response OmpR family regulator
MTPEQTDFMNQRHLPCRLSAREAGWLLGFSSHDITVLTSQRHLKPVGRPAQNSTKYYATVQIESLRHNIAWINRATSFLNRHWRDKNGGRGNGGRKK